MSRTNNILSLLFSLVFFVSACGPREVPDKASAPAETPEVEEGDIYPQRIVSFAPSLTEMLFILGLGDRVVGVSKFCKFPPAADALPEVGGFLDPNIEAVGALNPDLVVLFKKNTNSISQLEALGIPMLQLEGDTFEQVLSSMRKIGECCGKPKAAEWLVNDIRKRSETIREIARKGKKRPRVMLCIDRPMGSGKISNLYIAGVDGFFDKLIEMAGGESAYNQPGIHFPQLSGEGVMELDPDVIIDVCARFSQSGLTAETILADWDSLGDVKAVKEHRVYIFTEDYATVPGPRSILLLEKLARTLHPELSFKSEPDND